MRKEIRVNASIRREFRVPVVSKNASVSRKGIQAVIENRLLRDDKKRGVQYAQRYAEEQYKARDEMLGLPARQQVQKTI